MKTDTFIPTGNNSRQEITERLVRTMATPTETLATDGLSTRMATTVKAFLPVANALASREIGSEKIDLANGENSLMKLEILDICKKAMSDSITANVRQNQNSKTVAH
jgi:hypothetical protein